MTDPVPAAPEEPPELEAAEVAAAVVLLELPLLLQAAAASIRPTKAATSM